MSITDLEREMAAGIVHYEDRAFPLRIKEYTVTAPSHGRNIPHWHEDFEIAQIMEGICRYKVNDDEILLQKGDFLFVNSRAMHVNTRGDCPRMSARCLLFQPSLLTSNPMILAKYIEPVHRGAPFEYLYFPRNTEEAAECGRWMDMIYDAKRSSKPAYELEVLAGLHGLAACVYRHAANIAPAVDQRTPSADQEKIMLEFIYSNFRDRITLKDIAGSAYLSTHRCCEIFREKIGRSPVEYLNYYRLQVAARLLVSSLSRTIQQTGAECGFESPAYFTSQFKKQFGVSPREYRRRAAEKTGAG